MRMEKMGEVIQTKIFQQVSDIIRWLAQDTIIMIQR